MLQAPNAPEADQGIIVKVRLKNDKKIFTKKKLFQKMR